MIALFAGLCLAAASGDPAFVETVFRMPEDGARLALHDFTGDGALDLLKLDESGVALYTLGPGRTFAGEPTALLAWPAGRVGWDLCDLDGDGVYELALVLESGVVRVYRPLAGGGFDEGRTVLEAETYLPRGASRVRFARDVDGDGHVDVVLPGLGTHHVFLARPGTESGWAAPIEIAFELDARHDMGDPESLSSYFGQRVRVPWFRIEDVDGDGRADVVSETSDRVAFHLAQPELDSEPTWVLDLAALRADLPRRGNIDFDNLLSVLDDRVDWRIEDIDGKPPRDLIVMLGPKLRLYLGGARNGPVGTPDQVLKSSGNVLWTFVRQVEGDALPDLQIARGQRISVGRVLRSLILPSAIHFDLYTYRNEGGKFSTRPTRRNRVTIEIPRLLSFIEDADEFEEKIKAQFEIPARRLPRMPGAPARGDDIIDIQGSELVIFEGCAPEPFAMELAMDGDIGAEQLVESFFLADFDERGDGAERTIDIGDMATYDFAPGDVLRRSCKGREPALRHALALEPKDVTRLIARDIDGDGRTDVIVVGKKDDEWVVQFLVRSGVADAR